MPLREISVTKEGSKDIVAINNVIYNNFDLSKLPFLQYLKVDMKNAFSHIKHDEKLGRITSYTVHPSSFNPWPLHPFEEYYKKDFEWKNKTIELFYRSEIDEALRIDFYLDSDFLNKDERSIHFEAPGSFMTISSRENKLHRPSSDWEL